MIHLIGTSLNIDKRAPAQHTLKFNVFSDTTRLLYLSRADLPYPLHFENCCLATGDYISTVRSEMHEQYFSHEFKFDTCSQYYTASPGKCCVFQYTPESLYRMLAAM